jgi:hypothetical protein
LEGDIGDKRREKTPASVADRIAFIEALNAKSWSAT